MANNRFESYRRVAGLGQEESRRRRQSQASEVIFSTLFDCRREEFRPASDFGVDQAASLPGTAGARERQCDLHLERSQFTDDCKNGKTDFQWSRTKKTFFLQKMKLLRNNKRFERLSQFTNASWKLFNKTPLYGPWSAFKLQNCHLNDSIDSAPSVDAERFRGSGVPPRLSHWNPLFLNLIAFWFLRNFCAVLIFSIWLILNLKPMIN